MINGKTFMNREDKRLLKIMLISSSQSNNNGVFPLLGNLTKQFQEILCKSFGAHPLARLLALKKIVFSVPIDFKILIEVRREEKLKNEEGLFRKHTNEATQSVFKQHFV